MRLTGNLTGDHYTQLSLHGSQFNGGWVFTKVELNERFALTKAKAHLYHRAAVGSMFATLLSFYRSAPLASYPRLSSL
jgi:hypothetical protein